jgi:hypothetical protein
MLNTFDSNYKTYKQLTDDVKVETIDTFHKFLQSMFLELNDELLYSWVVLRNITDEIGLRKSIHKQLQSKIVKYNEFKHQPKIKTPVKKSPPAKKTPPSSKKTRASILPEGVIHHTPKKYNRYFCRNGLNCINGHNKRVGYVNNEYARVLIDENEEERIFKIDVCKGCKDAAADAIENNAPDSQDVSNDFEDDVDDVDEDVADDIADADNNDIINDDFDDDEVNSNIIINNTEKKEKKVKKQKDSKKQKKEKLISKEFALKLLKRAKTAKEKKLIKKYL